jgi:hypothetical protein
MPNTKRELVVGGTRMWLRENRGGEGFLPFYAEAFIRKQSNPDAPYFIGLLGAPTEMENICVHYAEDEKAEARLGRNPNVSTYRSSCKNISITLLQHSRMAKIVIDVNYCQWIREFDILTTSPTALFDEFEDEFKQFRDVVKDFVDTFNRASYHGIPHRVGVVNVHGLDDVRFSLNRGPMFANKSRAVHCTLEELSEMDAAAELASNHGWC